MLILFLQYLICQFISCCICLFFFLLGFFLYAFYMAQSVQLLPKLRDINTSVMPVTFLFIIAFIVDVFSLSSELGRQCFDESLLIYPVYFTDCYVYPNRHEQRFLFGEIVISIVILICFGYWCWFYFCKRFIVPVFYCMEHH